VRHLLLTAVYAACIGTFFGSVLRDDVRSAIRLGLTLFAVMVGAVLALGWLMLLLAP
jgi:hypothetical protein